MPATRKAQLCFKEKLSWQGQGGSAMILRGIQVHSWLPNEYSGAAKTLLDQSCVSSRV